jgi:hypothetical protein
VTRLIYLLALCAALLLAMPSGQYTGSWNSDGGIGSGKIDLKVTGTSQGDLSFTYQDQIVKPTKVTAKVSDAQVEFVCDVDLAGLQIRTTFQGTVDGKAITGKYKSTSAADGSLLDSGTWKATQP